MTILGTSGIFSFGVQSAQGAVATTFYRHKANDIDLDAMQEQQGVPLEVGGDITPTGAYKSGVFASGGATVLPRMEGDLGWLLKAGLGSVVSNLHLESEAGIHAAITMNGTPVTTGITTPTSPGRKLVLTVTLTASVPASPAVNIVLAGTAGTPTETFNIAGMGPGVHYMYGATVFDTLATITPPTVSGGTFTIGQCVVAATAIYDHVFTYATDQTALPFLTLRKFIPGRGAVAARGLSVLDALLSGMSFTFPNGGLVQARLDSLGRVPSWTDAPSWTYSDAFENHKSIPQTCNTLAGITMPDIQAGVMPVTGAMVQLVNQLTSPQEEKIIGSPYMDDIAVRTRAMSVRMGVKWNNPDLYAKIFTNAISSANAPWSDIVLTTPIDIKTVSAGFIGSSAYHYALRVRAAQASLSLDGPIRLVAGGILSMGVTGLVQTPDSADKYVEVIVTNAQASY